MMLILANVGQSADGEGWVAAICENARLFAEFVIKDNSFASGMVLGACLAAGIYHLAGKAAATERANRATVDAQRETELRSQLALKEERISKLHDELEKRSSHHQTELEKALRKKPLSAPAP